MRSDSLRTGEMAQGQHAVGRSTEGSGAVVSGEAAHAANLLVLDPARSEQGAGACHGRLDAVTDPDSVLLVCPTGNPAARLAAWREHATTDPPGRVAVVASGAGTEETLPVPRSEVVAEVVPVGQPPDLVDVWLAVSDRLDRWDGRTAVCLGSLTTLLAVAAPRRTLRFCKTLAERVRTGGDTAHYHLDPGAVDDRVVEALATILDAVAEPLAGPGPGRSDAER